MLARDPRANQRRLERIDENTGAPMAFATASAMALFPAPGNPIITTSMARPYNLLPITHNLLSASPAHPKC